MKSIFRELFNFPAVCVDFSNPCTARDKRFVAGSPRRWNGYSSCYRVCIRHRFKFQLVTSVDCCTPFCFCFLPVKAKMYSEKLSFFGCRSKMVALNCKVKTCSPTDDVQFWRVKTGCIRNLTALEILKQSFHIVIGLCDWF